MSHREPPGSTVSCVDDVLITQEFLRRPFRPPDYEAESRALSTLAREMASNPQGVLQRLVELVLEVCDADSAGVSILEPGGENGIFRWNPIAGAFASNLNGTMPREASPCGTVIARDSVLLFDNADRFFPDLRGVEPRIYESLLAPWHVDGEPVGTLWAIKHTPQGRFDAEDARLLESLSEFASAAYQMTSALDEATNRGDELERRTRALSAANEALRASEERFWLIVEEATDYAIFTTDAERRIETWPPGAVAVFGWTAEEAIGEGMELIFTSEDRAAGVPEQEFATARDAGMAPDVRWHLRKDGTRVFIEGATYGLRGPDGGFRGVLKIGQDVTVRHQAEQAQVEREAFVEAAAHDLRNPLTSLKGQVQLLQRRARREGPMDATTLTPRLTAISDAANQMAALLDEMMDATHLQAGRALELRRAPIDLVTLAQAAAEETQRRTTRHRVRVETGASALVGVWDETRLERVLGNLLDNAVKYSPHRGEIVVRLGCEETTAGTWAMLSVSDQGVGIPVADLPQLFERFHRGRNVTSILGTGIGLSGAKQIVEQHSGTISVESVEGQGSSFTVRLPLTPVPARETGRDQPA